MLTSGSVRCTVTQPALRQTLLTVLQYRAGRLTAKRCIALDSLGRGISKRQNAITGAGIEPVWVNILIFQNEEKVLAVTPRQVHTQERP